MREQIPEFTIEIEIKEITCILPSRNGLFDSVRVTYLFHFFYFSSVRQETKAIANSICQIPSPYLIYSKPVQYITPYDIVRMGAYQIHNLQYEICSLYGYCQGPEFTIDNQYCPLCPMNVLRNVTTVFQYFEEFPTSQPSSQPSTQPTSPSSQPSSQPTTQPTERAIIVRVQQVTYKYTNLYIYAIV
jgi:hypothetical protein